MRAMTTWHTIIEGQTFGIDEDGHMYPVDVKDDESHRWVTVACWLGISVILGWFLLSIVSPYFTGVK